MKIALTFHTLSSKILLLTVVTALLFAGSFTLTTLDQNYMAEHQDELRYVTESFPNGENYDYHPTPYTPVARITHIAYLSMPIMLLIRLV